MTVDLTKESYGENVFLNHIVVCLGSNLSEKDNSFAPHFSSSMDTKKKSDNCDAYSKVTQMKDKLLTLVDDIMTFDNIDECADHLTNMTDDVELHLFVTDHRCENICLLTQQLPMCSHIYSVCDSSPCKDDKITESVMKESKCLSWHCSHGGDAFGLIKSLKHKLDCAWTKLTSENVSARYKKENSYQNACRWLEDGELAMLSICLMDCLPLLPLNTSAKNDVVIDA